MGVERERNYSSTVRLDGWVRCRTEGHRL